MAQNKLNLHEITYVINSNDDKTVATIYKAVGEDRYEPISKEELLEILELLGKQAKEASDFKYDANKINLDSITEIIIQKIEQGELKTDGIEDYLASINVYASDRQQIKNNITEYFKAKTNSDNNAYITDFLNDYKDNLHKQHDKEISFITRITKKDNNIIEVQMLYTDSREPDHPEHSIQKATFFDSTTVREMLISNMASEFALNGAVQGQSVAPNGDGFDSSLLVSNSNNNKLEIIDFNNAFVYELNDKIDKTKALNSYTLEEKQNNEKEQQQQDEELRQGTFMDNMLPEEREAINRQMEGPTRKLVLNNNNSGKINKIYIFICLLIALALLIYATIQIFNL